MILAQFSIACGAAPTWVRNAARILGWSLDHSVDEARRLGLVKQVHDDLRVPLEVAEEVARIALSDPGAKEVELGDGQMVGITTDVNRYLSDFTVRLARALSHHESRRSGRRVGRRGGAVERARSYGLDIGQLESSLGSTPGDRIRRLDENMRFAQALRVRK